MVNYDIPSAPGGYVHRIGRVGRAGREGVAITFATPRQRRLLQNIERLTKQKIVVEKVPSVADLRDRQLELTIDAVRDALTSDDLDDYYSVYNALKGEGSDRDVALAAIKLVHASRGAVVDEPDIPDASDDRGGRGDRGGQNGKRAVGKGGGKGQGVRGGDSGFVYIALGRKGNVSPGDLVGAIANETSLSGSDIGPIRISDNYSVVGVPSDAVDDVVNAIQRSTVKGKKTKARRYVE